VVYDYAAELPLLLPELLLLVGILVLPFVPVRAGSQLRSRATTALLLVALGLVVWMMAPDGGWLTYFPDTPARGVALGFFEIAEFALFFKLVFLVVALLVSMVSADQLRERTQSVEYYALLLLAVVGMMVVASARDLITLFVGLETAVLSSFVLAGYRRLAPGPTEAATKFFIVGALSAALTLYGISLVYAVTGTVDLYEIAGLLADPATRSPALLVAMAFLVAGFGFEITAVPFHMWAPDVYEGSPDTVSAFISGASKKMGFAAFFKVFFVGLIAMKFQWDVLVGVLAVATMTVGNLAALRQTSLKRLLAWSSIGQAGYIMIALAVGTPFAMAGGFFHVLTHALMKGGAFLIVGLLAVRGLGDQLDAYRGLYKRAPLAAATLAVLMLSMAGIPPLAGFASKFILFGGAISAGVAEGNNWYLFLAVAGIANSALSLVYYARVVRVVYVDEGADVGAPARLGLPAVGYALMTLLLVLVIFMGVWPQPWFELGRSAALSLLGLT
jgi:proton-translocating NADH-quinone oxidoreductase chain N